MNPWMIQLIPIIWRWLRHFGIYLLIAVVVIGGPYLLYRKGYNDGWKAKVCPPSYTVGAGGVVNNYNADDYKLLGIRIKLLWGKLSLGY